MKGGNVVVGERNGNPFIRRGTNSRPGQFVDRVGFCVVYHSADDLSELQQTLYTANFVFVFKTNVPNEHIPFNPLGLAITYSREDEAFK